MTALIKPSLFVSQLMVHLIHVDDFSITLIRLQRSNDVIKHAKVAACLTIRDKFVTFKNDFFEKNSSEADKKQK